MNLNHFSNSKIHLLILSLFLYLNNCGGNAQGGEFSENLIEARVADGKQPQIFLQPGGTKVCRRGLPNESVYNLTPDELEVLQEQQSSSGEEDEAGESSGVEPSEQSTVTVQRNQVVTTDVEEAWFEMGLEIGNRSDKYYLRINQLIFYISANWGTEVLSRRLEITSGYCQSDPLYIIIPIPRGSKEPVVLKYLPYKKNHPNNLILFVSGVPLPEGPPKRNEEEEESQVMDNIRAELENQAPQQENNEQFVITYLPTYRVRLVLLGDWIDRDRNTKANFQKTIRFTLTSQFLN